MNYIIEISFSVVMILFVFFELIKINIFKKDHDALVAGLVSLLLLGFGFYLSIKYGLVLDYETVDEIKSTHAKLMSSFAIINLLTGIGFILISILKFVIWKIKQFIKKE